MQDRPRALGMAQPRPRRRGGVRSRSPDGRHAVGLLPPQLDRPGGGQSIREHLHLGAQHLGRLPAAGRNRQGPLATGRQQELVQDGPGHEDGVAARRPRPPKRRGHLLRRRLEPADPQPVAWGADRARLQDPPSAPRLRLHPSQPAAARRQPGQHADARRSERARRLRRRARDQRVRDQSGSLLFDAHLPFDMSFYRAYRFPWSGRPFSPPAIARRPEQHRRRDDRARELERRHRSGLLARACGQAHRVAHGAGDDPGRHDFESSTTLPEKYAYVAVQALDAAGHVLGASKTVQPISYAASLRRDEPATTQ